MVATIFYKLFDCLLIKLIASNALIILNVLAESSFDCSPFVKIADASKQPLCFVTTHINNHRQFKVAYSLAHVTTSILTPCLNMNIGTFTLLPIESRVDLA